MSHFRYNSNFPPGAYMSHFSLTSTNQVQQRFWEKHWRQQSPVSPAVYDSYHWRSPGMSGHGFTYGIPNFPPGLMHGCFDELQRFVQRQFGNIYSSRAGAGASPGLESCRDTETKVEVLEEGYSWSTCRNTNTSRQQKAFNTSIPQVNNVYMRPGTDNKERTSSHWAYEVTGFGCHNCWDAKVLINPYVHSS